ncbi:MAG TPA: 3-phosphoserine/phosphohydroxythreonine transaminase [Balneola sp.]|jgi:phosphoserine aminotransferase|nr:3-phosphoserine/phosphohydroxythreonine aminotransferase [Balneola sp.]MAO76440.1 3-phosphoserine/phosphohydroxythreonine aminotransferase [Balneola sp.]MBF65631.1 3-phosphoserine/phosphohydroxythreonine aminotransferase [Balneola sp.]HBZ40076.1 3-phosphoserine/phosphohydroxythreonine transaminase [Balneola sp.]|tara:strand:- start:1585 stop:2664 length:1080 start_codon:yes stop_codon:yes gene_type:complete
MKRAHNFSAGPAALPLDVLEQAKAEFTNYQNTGSSIMEMSHRGPEYTRVDSDARESLKRILNLEDNYEIMFLQGGASLQFLQIAMNFLGQDETADYINTGAWSQKAIKEAKAFGNVNIAFTSEDSNFSRVPNSSELKLTPNANFVHYTSNNTIFGTQFATEPETNGIPLVCDASSDFLSRPIDIKKYGLIYAGAQKNLGPSGVAVVIIRKDFLAGINKTGIPTMLDYRTHAGKLFHTPPTFTIYLVSLVLKWLEEKGGLDYFENLNNEKAELLYSTIDSDDFYRGTAEVASRSKMNVTFRLPTEDLEQQFLTEAKTHNLVSLKGHRSVGGIRASIYNACELSSVKALTDFMNDFRSKNG